MKGCSKDAAKKGGNEEESEQRNEQENLKTENKSFQRIKEETTKKKIDNEQVEYFDFQIHQKTVKVIIVKKV